MSESLIKPGTPEAKQPLKRSTIAAIVVVVLGLLLIGALMRQAAQGSRAAPEDPTRLNNVGSEAAIDAESARIQVVERPVVVPTRSDNTVAIEANAKAPEQDPHEQMESAGVVSRMLVMDNPPSSQEEAARNSSNPADDSVRQLMAINQASNAARANVQVGDGQIRGGAESSPAIQLALEQMRRQQGAPGTREQANQAWLKEFSGLPADAALKPKLVKGSYVLSQGKVIPAILSRNINSDLPGEVTARVAVDVYDSFDGTHVLIPKGSELYGAYSSGVNVGQQRLMFAFRRVVLPNRVTFDLPAAKGMDLAGAAGVEGDVNNHFFKMFGTSMLFALLSYGAEKNEPAPSGLGSSGGARTAAGQALVDVSRTVLDRNKTIPPTITVAAGTRINVQVASDMEFPSPYGAAAR